MIIVNTWDEADAIIPQHGLKVIILNQGEFTFYHMWNPFAKEYQWVRC